MYERSAIVLERYFEMILGLNKESNLKVNYENYNEIVKEIKEYKNITEEEDNIIIKFDEVVEQIQEIQSKQANIHELTQKLETERNELFNDLSENTSSLDQRLQKIEGIVDKNNESLKDLREKKIPDECINCEHSEVCHGGLKCLTYAMYKDLNHKDYGCNL